MTWELYSKRMKLQRGEMPDVYQYDSFPEKLRNQIYFIFKRYLKDRVSILDDETMTFRNLDLILREEHGYMRLPGATKPLQNAKHDIQDFLSKCSDIEYVLDAIEAFLHIFSVHVYTNKDSTSASQYVEEVTQQFNTRFHENGVGYQVVNTQITRVDSKYIHQEAVKPALYLLQQPRFEAANESYLIAHQYYREGKLEDAITNAVKAFESVMKVLLKERNVDAENKTLRKLIVLIQEYGVIDATWQNHLSHLVGLLQTVGTSRNKMSAHGASEPRNIPPELVAFTLHMTASSILFLGESCEKSKRSA